MKKLFLTLALVTGAWQTCNAEAPAAQVTMGEQEPHPFFRDALLPAWSQMTPEQLLVDARAAMEEARKRRQTLLQVTPETATFDNTFLAAARINAQLQQVQCYMMHLMNVASTPELMQAQATMQAEAARFQAETAGDSAIGHLLEEAARAPWAQQLSPARKRYIEQALKRRQMGEASLSPEQRKRLAEINKEIRRLSLQFYKNLGNSRNTWELEVTDPDMLDGLPERWREKAAKAARAKGIGTDEKPAWLITQGNAHEVLTHCAVEETRRQCWLGTSTHCQENEALIYRTMELRHECAQLLGFRNYADMQAKERMTGSGEKALAFVDGMLNALKPLYDAEIDAYLNRLSQAKGEPITKLNPWDEAYLSHRAPAPATPGFDSGQLTPYFETERVLRGMMEIWEHLLSIRITEHPTVQLNHGEPCPSGKVEVWHKDVRFYTVHDTSTGCHLGSFYLDLYPRRDKRGDGWTTPIRFGHEGEPHLAAMVTNITPPGHPHLLNHGDVYVIFHEFGHLMHMLLGHPELPEHHAMSVERDFIEMPSQLQEQWIWEPEALATFAIHHKTGEPLPADLARQLAENRKNSPVSDTMRMLRHAKLDLEINLYFHEKFKGRPLDEVAAELLAPWQIPYSVPTPSDMRTVHHTMNPGYAASFYTYIWSEAMSMDAFSRFRKEGIMNPATGADYRRCILEPGGSKPALELFRDFMGREPDSAAFLQRFGANQCPPDSKIPTR